MTLVPLRMSTHSSGLVIFFIMNTSADYIDLIGEPFPYADRSFSEIKIFLENIDDVYSVRSSTGDLLWYVNSEHAQHITKMIEEQKPARVDQTYGKRMKNDNNRSNVGGRTQYLSRKRPIEREACFYSDNYEYKQKR